MSRPPLPTVLLVLRDTEELDSKENHTPPKGTVGNWNYCSPGGNVRNKPGRMFFSSTKIDLPEGENQRNHAFRPGRGGWGGGGTVCGGGETPLTTVRLGL